MTPPVGSLLAGVRLAEADQLGHDLVLRLRLQTGDGQSDHRRHPDPRSTCQPDAAEHLVQPIGLGWVAEAEPVSPLGPDLGAGVLDSWCHDGTVARLAEAMSTRTHENTRLDVWYSKGVKSSTEVSR